MHYQGGNIIVMECIPRKQRWNEMEDTSIDRLFTKKDWHEVEPSRPDCYACWMILSRCIPIFGDI